MSELEEEHTVQVEQLEDVIVSMELSIVDQQAQMAVLVEEHTAQVQLIKGQLGEAFCTIDLHEATLAESENTAQVSVARGNAG